MRLFVAIELPAAVRREALRRAAAVRERLPAARWVRPEAMHLTLRFLGEVEPDRVAVLSPALAEAFAASPPFTLALHGGGCYPPRRPARVAWAGVRADGTKTAADPLLALQARVEAASAAFLGEEPERRPFSPHVTLARCKQPWNRDEVEAFTAALAGPVGEPFAVDRGALIQSRLSPQGARHDTLETFPLPAAEAVLR